MRIEKIKIGAVIPVQKYGNLQPEIEISSDDRGEDLLAAGMDVIKGLFSQYSEVGGLEEKDIVSSVSVKLLKKSFNEDVVIEFEPIAHTYTYQDKQLTGATDYTKRFYKPFDADTISSVLESKWGVPQKVIKDLWDANGTLASDFGSVVHQALENFDKFKEYGDIISSQQKEEKNYCLPKHPVLRQIVEGFIAIDNKGGVIVPEALISDVKKGICGHADRVRIIDKEKKICDVEDYKINIDSETAKKELKPLDPFKELPSNKLSKYQLQMSIYANMLQSSGWQVNKLVVYVYEDIWKKYELEVLKVI